MNSRLALTIGLAAAVQFAPWLAPAASAQKDEAKAEDISLTTRDGLILKATYYAPATKDGRKKEDGKDVVPVVMLHDYKKNRADFNNLAKGLQQHGFAVLVPDLRGHGQSTKFAVPGRPDLDVNKLRPVDFADMIRYDFPALRSFLIEKNDAGELNLNRMAVVGAEMGAALAVNWVAEDWKWPNLPSVKQGQDIKALILISPVWSIKGVRINQAIAQPVFRSSQVSVLILVGGRQPNAKPLAEAKRLHKALKPYHPEPEDPEDVEKTTLFFETADTSLIGTELLQQVPVNRGVSIVDAFSQFLTWRAAQPDYPWSARKQH